MDRKKRPHVRSETTRMRMAPDNDMARTAAPTASASPSGSSSAPRQRLPVNPRRNKVAPHQRKRVATACNNCNVRRVKCSGDRPACLQCVRGSRDCQYPEAVEKIMVTKTEWEELKRRCAELESLQGVTDDSAAHELAAHNVPRTPSPPSSTGGTSSRLLANDDHHGRLLHDADGTARYLGETSAATFLDTLKGFMSTLFPLAFHQNLPNPQDTAAGTAFLASVGRYQTFDSRPLSLPPVDPMCLPSRTEMTLMLAALRYFLQDSSGEFPSGGIFFWGDLSSLPQEQRSSLGSPRADAQCPNLALFHTVFAFATQLSLTAPNSKVDGQLGEPFFARARTLLGNPLDFTTYNSNDVSVLALMAMYLVENNRRDAAYIYVTNAMHISFMHGVHRGWAVDEMGKRVFWTVYILDRWLSSLLGRPLTIPDDAIQLPMPEDVPGLPPAVGLKAHIELARVSGYIVSSSYCVTHRGRIADSVESYVHRALELLADWQRKLPAFMQIPDEPPFSNDRGCCSLHMAQGQLVILTVRPIFFMAVKKAVADWFVSGQWDIEEHPHISLMRDCSDVSRRNLRLGRWLAGISPAGKLLLPDLHHIFNAAIILMLHHIVFINLRTKDVVDIAFAIECFENEANTGSDYGKDCAKVLRDLWALVQRLRNLMIDGGGDGKISPLPGEHILASLSTAGGCSLFAAGATGATSAGATGIPHHPHIPPPGRSHYQAEYQELATWIHSDDMQFYNNFLS